MDRKSLLLVWKANERLPDRPKGNSRTVILREWVAKHNLEVPNVPERKGTPDHRRKLHSNPRMQKMVTTWSSDVQSEMKKLLKLPQTSDLASNMPVGDELNRLAFVPLPVNRDELWKTSCLDAVPKLCSLFEPLEIDKSVLEWQKTIFPPITKEMEDTYIYNPWYLIYTCLLSLCSCKKKAKYMKLLAELPHPKSVKDTLLKFVEDYPVLALVFAPQCEDLQVALLQATHKAYQYAPYNQSLRLQVLDNWSVGGTKFITDQTMRVRARSIDIVLRTIRRDIRIGRPIAASHARRKEVLLDQRMLDILTPYAKALIACYIDLPEVMEGCGRPDQSDILDFCYLSARRSSPNTLKMLLDLAAISDSEVIEIATDMVREERVQPLEVIEKYKPELVLQINVSKMSLVTEKSVLQFFDQRDMLSVELLRKWVVTYVSNQNWDFEKKRLDNIFEVRDSERLWDDPDFFVTVWESCGLSANVRKVDALLSHSPGADNAEGRARIAEICLGVQTQNRYYFSRMKVSESLMSFPGTWEACNRQKILQNAALVLGIGNVLKQLQLSTEEKQTLADTLAYNRRFGEYKELCEIFVDTLNAAQVSSHLSICLSYPCLLTKAALEVLLSTSKANLGVHRDELYDKWLEKQDASPDSLAQLRCVLQRPELPCKLRVLLKLIDTFDTFDCPEELCLALDSTPGLKEASLEIWKAWIPTRALSSLERLLDVGIPKGLDPSAGNSILLSALSAPDIIKQSEGKKLFRKAARTVKRPAIDACGGVLLINLVKGGTAKDVIWLMEQGAAPTPEAMDAAIERDHKGIIRELRRYGRK